MEAWRHLPYFLATALESLRRNQGRAALSLLSVTTPLYLLGIFATVSGNLAPYVGTLAREARLVVFLESDVTDAERQDIEGLLVPPSVTSFAFVSPDEARKRLTGLLGTAPGGAASLPVEALPASYEVVLSPSASANPEPLSLQLHAAPGVEEVRSQADLTRRLALILTAVRGLGAFLAVILVAAALITVSNTIRLVFLGRRDEVEILKVVGASDDFVRGPFLVEGTIYGLVGGLAAAVLLHATRALVAWAVNRRGGLIAEVAAGAHVPVLVSVLLILAGAAIGLAAAATALARLLRPAEGRP